MAVELELTGQKFGELTAIEKVGYDKRHNVLWRCQCKCGKEKITQATYLTSGKVRSCGCVNKEFRYRNLVGQKFGRLTPIEHLWGECKSGKRVSKWRCLCDCGKETIVLAGSLLTGATRSCGCFHNEMAIKRSTKHGHRHERLYAVWLNIKARCYNPHNNKYQNYGGRGISMCDEWLNDYMSFRTWAYDNGYDELAPKWACTLDRINSDKNYCPENCRWVSMKKQQNNKSNNHYIELNGETKTMSEWAEALSLPYSMIRARQNNGWSAADTLLTPSGEIKFSEVHDAKLPLLSSTQQDVNP